MVVCVFCGSENTRPSRSSALDAPITRVVRALTFRRLYRCRSCDALFEAAFTGGADLRRRNPKPQTQSLLKQPISSDLEVSTQRLVG
jgi:hypothetical protein